MQLPCPSVKHQGSFKPTSADLPIAGVGGSEPERPLRPISGLPCQVQRIPIHSLCLATHPVVAATETQVLSFPASNSGGRPHHQPQLLAPESHHRQKNSKQAFNRTGFLIDVRRDYLARSTAYAFATRNAASTARTSDGCKTPSFGV